MSGLLSKTGKSKPAPKEKAPAPKKAPQIRVAKNVYRRQIARRIGKYISFALIALVGVYLCFAATIIRVIPSYGGLGPVPVKNITYPGGLVPAGAKIVVNLKEAQGNSGLDHLTQALVPNKNVAVVEVIGGPTGRITWAESGLVTLDGAPVPVTVAAKPSGEYLNKQYLVKCLEGPCKAGEGLIISQDNIYGQPL